MLFRTDTILKEFTNHLQDDLILDFTVSDLTVTLLPPTPDYRFHAMQFVIPV